MATTKEAPMTVEQRLAQLEEDNRRLEAQNRQLLEAKSNPGNPTVAPSAPSMVAAPTSVELRRDLENGQHVVADWLNKGCPLCSMKLTVDFPFTIAGLPGLYGAVLFHYGTVHKGQPVPPAPHPGDEAALDSPVAFGMHEDGTPRMIPYRQALEEVIRAYHRGVR